MLTFVKVWGIPTGIQMIHQPCISPIYLPRQLTSQTLCKYWRWSSFILISEFMKMTISVWFTSYLQLWKKEEKLQWKYKCNTHMTFPGVPAWLSWFLHPSGHTDQKAFWLRKLREKWKPRQDNSLLFFSTSTPFLSLLSSYFVSDFGLRCWGRWCETTDNSVKTLTLKDINQKESPWGTGGKN